MYRGGDTVMSPNKPNKPKTTFEIKSKIEFRGLPHQWAPPAYFVDVFRFRKKLEHCCDLVLLNSRYWVRDWIRYFRNICRLSFRQYLWLGVVWFYNFTREIIICSYFGNIIYKTLIWKVVRCLERKTWKIGKTSKNWGGNAWKIRKIRRKQESAQNGMPQHKTNERHISHREIKI